jgi:hypothetical protein
LRIVGVHEGREILGAKFGIDRALGWIPLEQTKLSFEKHWIFLLIASQPAVLG